jgi:hypothetical protein
MLSRYFLLSSTERLDKLTVDEVLDLEWFSAHGFKIVSAECLALNDRTARDLSVRRSGRALI